MGTKSLVAHTVQPIRLVINNSHTRADMAALRRRCRVAMDNIPRSRTFREQMPELADILEDQSRQLFDGTEPGMVATNLAICAWWLRECMPGVQA